jgi:hypothetical protein
LGDSLPASLRRHPLHRLLLCGLSAAGVATCERRGYADWSHLQPLALAKVQQQQQQQQATAAAAAAAANPTLPSSSSSSLAPPAAAPEQLPYRSWAGTSKPLQGAVDAEKKKARRAAEQAALAAVQALLRQQRQGASITYKQLRTAQDDELAKAPLRVQSAKQELSKTEFKVG